MTTRYQALMKKALILLVVVLAGYYGLLPREQQTAAKGGVSTQPTASAGTNAKLKRALRQRASNVQMKVSGQVVRLLSDDLEGSRHQRFTIEAGVGKTLLVAHNIDLAPRIEDIAVGDPIEVYGEYEWNERGGVIHWTHRDPHGDHAHGWIRHREHQYD